jgi:non-heme chloroperoxidase
LAINGRVRLAPGPGAKVSQGVIDNWWRQAMMGGAKAQYDGIKAFSETDFTQDLKTIDVPTLVMHGEDDQIVPIADSAPLSAKLLKKSVLKIYPKFPHGICTTHALSAAGSARRDLSCVPHSGHRSGVARRS